MRRIENRYAIKVWGNILMLWIYKGTVTALLGPYKNDPEPFGSGSKCLWDLV